MIVVGDIVAAWVAEAAIVDLSKSSRAVGWVTKANALVAGILYDGFTGSNINMHSRILSSEFVTREWLFAIFDYPFNQLGVTRVTGLVNSTNRQAIKVNEHLGWKRETVLKDYFPGADGLVYVMRKEDCQQLNFIKRVEQENLNALRPLHDASREGFPQTWEELSNS